MEGIKTGIIYKATNTVNGKAYIGLTTKELGRRISEHYRKSKTVNYYFYNALRKYNRDDWKWVILYNSIPYEHLGKMEQWCVANHDTFGNNGYNSTSGGWERMVMSYEAREKQRIASTKHGMKNTKIYDIWISMKCRPRVKDHILVCDEWYNSFEKFYEDVGDRTAEGMVLGRFDYKKDFCPTNCKWMTRNEQCAFKSIVVTNSSGFKGVRRSGKKWKVEMTIDGTSKYLGTFDTPEEASKVYQAARAKHYGRSQ